LDQATRIAITQASDYLQGGGGFARIVFACFGAKARDMYAAVIDEIIGD
jgi:hypothetical protein